MVHQNLSCTYVENLASRRVLFWRSDLKRMQAARLLVLVHALPEAVLHHELYLIIHAGFPVPRDCTPLRQLLGSVQSPGAVHGCT